MANSITFAAPNAVAQPAKEYIGNNYSGAVCGHIPEIATGLNPSIPESTFDFAYSSTNDFSGTMPAITERVVPLPKLTNFNLTPKQFDVQMTSYTQAQYESMVEQQEFATALNTGNTINPASIQKAKDTKIFNFVVESLANQVITRDEVLVSDLVTDDDQYTTANTNTIATAISSWTTSNGGSFAQALQEGATYLNKLSGNQLTKIQEGVAPVVNPNMELFIVIPKAIYTAFTGIFADVFSGYTALTGYDAAGNVGGAFKGMTPSLFGSIAGFWGAKVIVTESYQSLSQTGTLNTSNLVDIWDDTSVYMFTVSKDILKPASIVKATYRPNSMYQTWLLNTNYIRTEAIYDYLAPMDYNFYKIELTA